jgi:hypothetical protein
MELSKDHKEATMNIPTLQQAHTLLQEAELLNPGPWVQHSIFTAKAAEAIAIHFPGLDGQTAYILGLLHDIGRRAGITDMRHVLDGYTFLMKLGFSDAARICLTHSFVLQDAQAVAGIWDCSAEELQTVDELLQSIHYTTYDRLIQLCDCLAVSTGFCLMEVRFIDVAFRHGIDNSYKERWQAYYSIKNDFEDALKISIYQLLPGVVENTFGFNINRQ